MKSTYVTTLYNKKEKPFTEYPNQLAQYIFEKYDLRRNMYFLDNGTGRGEFFKAFEKLGLQGRQTDIYSKLEGVCLLDLSKDNLPFEDETFDFVFSKSVIEHIINPDHFIDEMYRVLKKGGKIIILTPDFQYNYPIFYSDPTHVHPYTVKGMNYLMEMYKFKNIQTSNLVQLPTTWNSIMLRSISKLIRTITGPAKRHYKNKFYRFSKELMVLAYGEK